MQLPIQAPYESNVTSPPWIAHPIQFPVQGARIPEVLIQAEAASNWSLSPSKRLLDVSTAVAVLLPLLLPMLAIAICVRLSSKGPALFIQNRVGRGGRLFGIYKFRSMAVGAGGGPGITRSGDQRVTAFGYWLRRFKLDELPQLINILRGEMSLVGPRPKSPLYESNANMPYRPGITGAATLAFRREEEILSGVHASQLDFFYAKQIKPLKARLDSRYMSEATFLSDMRLIGATFFACLTPGDIPVSLFVEDLQQESDAMTA
jgi:lipopolysaccharide/colanic/teichoic acid biosynthesis glycosyltransferase